MNEQKLHYNKKSHKCMIIVLELKAYESSKTIALTLITGERKKLRFLNEKTT